MSKFNELADYLSHHATKLYSNQIAIIAVYGSVALGTQSDYSDLDMYAIVDVEDSDNPLINWSFIFQDRAVDLWSLDWKDAEELASGIKQYSGTWCVAASLFVNCKILYYRSEEDLARFNSLKNVVKQKEKDYKNNIKKAISLFKQLYKFENVELAKKNNDLLSARWEVWGLINGMCAILSWLNNSYYTKNWGSNLQQVFNLSVKPEGFQEKVTKLAYSNDFDEIMTLGRILIKDVRDLIKIRQLEVLSSFSKLNRNDFVHIKEYLNKIYAACDKQNILYASYAATELQIWIAELVAQNSGTPANTYEYNLYNEVNKHYNDLDLPDLKEFVSNRDFIGLHKNTKILESKLLEFYNKQEGKVQIFTSLDDLKLRFQNK